ncbi:MAG: methyltransferase [Cellulomonas sp.]|nr:methyltransferase [Cellulomonas sp.]
MPDSRRRATSGPQPPHRRRTDAPTGRTGAPARRPARAAARPPRPDRLEVTFLPGLGDVVHDEVVEVLHPPRPPRPVPGRDDALELDLPGWDDRVLTLRTAVAVFVSLHVDVPRPRSLVSGDHLARIAAAVRASLAVAPSRAFRFEAAGSGSPDFTRLGAALASAVGLPYAPDGGELVVKVRRGTAGRPGTDPGWDVLVRLGPRPLSARPWRSVDYPGAANATIAAAMVRLAGVRPRDRVVNLMCGSGTLLVERLLAGPTAAAHGVDLAAAALDAARANLAAAGVAATLTRADATDPACLGDERFDLLLADPPWGTLHGSHTDSPRLHTDLLGAAHHLAAPGARLVVLTHAVTVMERAVRAADGQWRAETPVRVFAKGHHPRIYLLRRC